MILEKLRRDAKDSEGTEVMGSEMPKGAVAGQGQSKVWVRGKVGIG